VLLQSLGIASYHFTVSLYYISFLILYIHEVSLGVYYKFINYVAVSSCKGYSEIFHHLKRANSPTGSSMHTHSRGRPLLGTAVAVGASRSAAKHKVAKQAQLTHGAQLSAQRAAEAKRLEEEKNDRAHNRRLTRQLKMNEEGTKWPRRRRVTQQWAQGQGVAAYLLDRSFILWWGKVGYSLEIT
jgi:hypothetical protein